MPVFAPGLSFSPELVEAMESMKAADSHWVAYAYTISRQVREGQLSRTRHFERQWRCQHSRVPSTLITTSSARRSHELAGGCTILQTPSGRGAF